MAHQHIKGYSGCYDCRHVSRVFCRFGQSTNICLTVSGSLQNSQTGWSSPECRLLTAGVYWKIRECEAATAER